MTPTPMTCIRLGGREVLLKREDRNPYGSHKIYGVRNYLQWLRHTGWLSPSSEQHLLVSSSGRFIEALAMATEDESVKVRLITDVLSSPALLKPLHRFAHLTIDEPIDDPDETGSHLKARLRRIAELVEQRPRALFVDQYRDPLIAQGYQKWLAPQIQHQVGDRLGAVFAPVGTGGLVHGLVRYREQTGDSWPIFAADAVGSALFRTPPPGTRRKLPGYGNGIRTGLLAAVSEQVVPVWVPDADAVATCHQLLSDGLWLGPSSGATAAAFLQILRDRPHLLPQDDPVVLICPDAGNAYASTVYDPLWLLRNGFAAPPTQRAA